MGNHSTYDGRASSARSRAGGVRSKVLLAPVPASGLVLGARDAAGPRVRPSHTCSRDDVEKQGQPPPSYRKGQDRSHPRCRVETWHRLWPQGPGLSTAVMTAGPVTLWRLFLSQDATRTTRLVNTVGVRAPIVHMRVT